MPRLLTLLGAFLLLLTALLYAISLVNLLTMHGSDPAGNSLSQAYAVFIVIGLWVLLAVLSLIAGLKGGGMPKGAAVAAMVLLPASGAAAVAAIHLLSDRFYQSRWPIVIPILAPVLIVAVAVWVYLPAWRQAVPAATAGPVIASALLVLSIAPWPAVVYRARHRVADQARAEADWKADEPRRVEQARRENLAAFQKLTSASELSEWLAFRQPGNELREQALEAIRGLPRRQADAEEMMRRGLDYFWEDVARLDLTATPPICERGRLFLRERARDIQPPHPEDPPRFGLMKERVEPYLPTMQWLVDQRCECDTELAAIEGAVRIYPDSPERNQVLEMLRQIRQSGTRR
jgi:hypothetical protein